MTDWERDEGLDMRAVLQTLQISHTKLSVSNYKTDVLFVVKVGPIPIDIFPENYVFLIFKLESK